MKFSGKMCHIMILKVTRNHGFTHFLEDTIFEKPQGGQIDPPPTPPTHPSRFRVKGVNFVFLKGT